MLNKKAEMDVLLKIVLWIVFFIIGGTVIYFIVQNIMS